MSDLSETIGLSHSRMPQPGKRRLPVFTASANADMTPQDPAQQQLAALREKFSEELQALRQAAQQEGLALGRERAAAELAEARSHLQADQERQLRSKIDDLQQAALRQAETLQNLTKTLHTRADELSATMEPVIGHLALAVVTKLLGKQLADRSLVFACAAQAVKEYRLSGPLRIRVAAADYAFIKAAQGDDPVFAAFEIDHELDAGDCIIDYGRGQLEVGFTTQIAAVKALLTSASKDMGHVGEA
jgi:flagellar biosynthesis/type III secretory pathway protein FliH